MTSSAWRWARSARLHTHSVAHNRETLPTHQRVAEAIQRGHHRKAEAAMREIVEGARADALTVEHPGADVLMADPREGTGTS